MRRALAAGHREIVLTGINIGTYDGGASERGPRGSHAWAALSLAGLVRRILAETAVERIRLSSIEPQHVDDELLAAWTGEGAGRCLPHFHLPLQSGDDGVLRRMGRRYTSDGYAGVVGRIRAILPEAAIHADVIVGFPTEDEVAFQATAGLVRSLDLAGLHVFRYSARPDTPAARMAGHVDERTRRRRSAELLALATGCRTRFASRSLGHQRLVLFEEQLPDGRWVGHAEDHVLVAAAPSAAAPSAAAPSAAGAASPVSLQNAIGRIQVETVDPDRPDRLVGRLIAIDAGPARSIRRALRPALAGRGDVPSASSRAACPAKPVRSTVAGADHAA